MTEFERIEHMLKQIRVELSAIAKELASSVMLAENLTRNISELREYLNEHFHERK